MDDFIGFIIFALIFVLGPLIEQLRRKQQRPPGQPLPRPQVPQERPRAQTQTTTGTDVSRTEEMSATTMLPDELWEVLTGQPRPRPTPAPVPAPDLDDEEVFDEEALITEDVQVETRRTQWEEGVSLERTTRHEVPVVVSMETMPEAPKVRHEAFHRKLDQSPPLVVAESRSNLPHIKGRKALRHAMLMQAILGKPKALE